jgi:hypothetical protein
MKIHALDYLRKSFHTLENQRVMRRPVTPHEILSVTLQFLATGRNYEDLKFSAVISAQALRVIIPEKCTAIYEELK